MAPSTTLPATQAWVQHRAPQSPAYTALLCHLPLSLWSMGGAAFVGISRHHPHMHVLGAVSSMIPEQTLVKSSNTPTFPAVYMPTSSPSIPTVLDQGEWG